MADFKLCTHAELVVLTILAIDIYPKLRLGEEDKALLLAVFVKLGNVAIPQISKATEGKKVLGECHAPHGSNLEAGQGITTHALEELLVHYLQGEGAAEVRTVPLPCGTNESSLLERTTIVQSTVILNMSCNAVLALVALQEGEVTTHLPIGTDSTLVSYTLATVVHIHKEVG